MPQTSPELAKQYAELCIKRHWQKVRIYGFSYYSFSVFALLMAVSPGIIYAVLQLFKESTDSQTYTLIALSTVVCSSIASFTSSVLGFFVVREKFSAYKAIFYRLTAEYTLYKSGTSSYYQNPKGHLLMLSRITSEMRIKETAHYDPSRKAWPINGRN